jgi:hypothetical protein
MMPLALLLAGFYASTARAEVAHDTVSFSCSTVTFNYYDFPNAPDNTVTEVVHSNGTSKSTKFTFNGPEGSSTVHIVLPPGHSSLDGQTKWNTNGVKGGQDVKDPGGVTCGEEEGFKIEKFQKINGKYATTTLTGKVGETVDYKIVVTNTGNVPLTFTEFIDAHCDPGTITGGPGASPVEYGESTEYFCTHALTEADRIAGSVTNTATVTGTPPEGPSVTHESNPVVVEVPDPANTAEFSCTAVTFTFTGFPNKPGNTVTEIIRSEGKVIYKGTFVFNGTSGSNTVAIKLSPGHHSIDGETKWNTNGFKGGQDVKGTGGITCAAPEPGFSIEKLQEIAGSGEGFTREELKGEVGQTVDYEIVVKNTGNVPLTFSEFTDPNCEEGTIAGGPVGAVEAGGSAIYTCSHLLTVQNELEGTYTNTATDTATPPEGDGPPITHGSNTVVVEVTSII